MQWAHSRLHQVPVIWIQSAERRRKGTTGACPAPGSFTTQGQAHAARLYSPAAVVSARTGKMLSGMKAETIQLGASTISLILRSAATLHTM